jgi:hypothetical protein
MVNVKKMMILTYSVLGEFGAAVLFGFVSKFVGLDSVHLGSSNIINNRA